MTGDLLQQELRRSLPALRTLPEHIDELATQLRSGRLSVRVERFAGRDERGGERVDRPDPGGGVRLRWACWPRG